METDLELELPPADVEDRLLAGLARLLEQCGWETLVSQPILHPDPKFFPDRWEPNLGGARRLLRRLMLYAGLGDLDLSVRSFTEATWHEFDARGVGHGGEGTLAWFAGIHDGVCRFGVNEAELRDAEDLVGTLAHEVAHAFRYARGVVVTDSRVEEKLTDLTAVYLGFGAFVLENSLVFRTGGYTRDGERLLWERKKRGYLSPAELALLFGAQLVARAMPERERKVVLSALSPNHRQLLADACVHFDEDADALRARLGVPDVAEHPPPLSLERFTSDLDDDEDDEDDDFEPDATARTAERRSHDRAGMLGLLGASAPLLAASVAPLEGKWLLASIVVAGATGIALGRALTRHTCSACSGRVASGAGECPDCGARFLTAGADANEDEDFVGEDSDDEDAGDGETARLLTAVFVAWVIRRDLAISHDDEEQVALDELRTAVESESMSATALHAAWPWIHASLAPEAAAFADAYFDERQIAWPEDFALLTTLVGLRDTPATYRRFAQRFDDRFAEHLARLEES